MQCIGDAVADLRESINLSDQEEQNKKIARDTAQSKASENQEWYFSECCGDEGTRKTNSSSMNVTKPTTEKNENTNEMVATEVNVDDQNMFNTDGQNLQSACEVTVTATRAGETTKD